MTPKKLKAAAIGGGAAGIASSIPLVNLANCACCALVVGGGMLAVYLAMRGEPAAEKAPLGEGAMIGVLAGVAAAVVGAILAIPLAALVGDPMEQMRSIMEGIDGIPPEVLEALGGEDGDVGAALGLIGFLFNLVTSVIFSGIGGVIGAAVFHKKPMLETGA